LSFINKDITYFYYFQVHVLFALVAGARRFYIVLLLFVMLYVKIIVWT